MGTYNLDFTHYELMLIRAAMADRLRLEEKVLAEFQRQGNERLISVCESAVQDCKRIIDRLRPYTDLPSQNKQ